MRHESGEEDRGHASNTSQDHEAMKATKAINEVGRSAQGGLCGQQQTQSQGLAIKEEFADFVEEHDAWHARAAIRK